MSLLLKVNTIAVLGVIFILFSPSPANMNSSSSNADLSKTVPLNQAHAHNDYQHRQPLKDALTLGFTSIEADIYLIQGELYVSHLPPLFLNPERTLSKLYLDPLLEIYKTNGGKVFNQQEQVFYLMIDIKTNKNKTYEKLKEVLRPYHQMLSSWQNNILISNSVNIILSGNRPIDQVHSEAKRYVQIDGRIEDLGKGYPVEFMPIISDNYSKVCSWQFFSKSLNRRNSKRINQIAQQVHEEGKQFRLWNIPESESIWGDMLTAGVDFINTDKISKLSTYLRKRKPDNASFVATNTNN